MTAVLASGALTSGRVVVVLVAAVVAALCFGVLWHAGEDFYAGRRRMPRRHTTVTVPAAGPVPPPAGGAEPTPTYRQRHGLDTHDDRGRRWTVANLVEHTGEISPADLERLLGSHPSNPIGAS